MLLKTSCKVALAIGLGFAGFVHAGPADQAAARLLQSQQAARAAAVAAQAQRTAHAARAEQARKMYSAQNQARQAAAAQRARQRVESASLPARRPAPPIANDVHRRAANGSVQRLSPAGSTVRKNSIGGKVGEIRSATDLRAAGYKVRSQVSARIGGQKRVIDHVALHPNTGKLVAFETKTGGALYGGRQARFDQGMATSGAAFVGARAGSLAGTTQSMPTFVLRY